MKTYKEFISEKTLSAKEILAAMKYDPEANMMGWIGEFPGNKSDNNNLGGTVTLKTVTSLEKSGKIEFVKGDDIWVIKSEYDKVK